MIEMPSEQILQEKSGEVDQILRLICDNKVIGIASLQKVRASQLQAFKKNLVGKVQMRVVKNTLMKRAIENCQERSDLKKLEEYLTGANIFLLTSLNPFQLASILEKGKVQTTAKSGDIAAFDVVVPQGNTGQPPGPIISQLNTAGLPTRIESGSVWVSRDTLVVRKGEKIDERLAGVLSKLGIKPVESGLSMTVAYDDGLIILGNQLHIDEEETKRNVQSAYTDALALSLGVAYPTMENATMLIQVAHKEAYALSLNAPIPSKENIDDLLRIAHMEMLSLSSRLSTVEEKTPSVEKPKESSK